MAKQQRAALTDIQNASTEELQTYYDRWSDAYDADLAAMGYQAPQVAARLLRDYDIAGEEPILDVGCGTGLTGQALQQQGFNNITGLDLSPVSLQHAEAKGCYGELHECDITQPLPLENRQFAAVQCIGTLTYVRDTSPFMRELCRVVQPGGLILFTQRKDLYGDAFQCALDTVTAQGLWSLVHHSEPQPYLPNYDAFDSAQDIYYDLYRAAD
ncbi:class I SAM-dependent DNA methyltransferase [Salinisphaera hydrothermalis]|uniref:Methyltransferase type 11 n=1 Tax=Salinisphaera hydrothermalis (strain C41B8) TaxID=1304275 RepID=A0A084IH80_SALHC|nr:class I SAM-dependent methyltransferase [Salinisphaera hydrothermalis]KEZ76064.1 methyltransferase type 11 [Salinisphaera hydrothermalis C41B8]